jgi:glucose-1-phosphate thymidylyltransferase
MAHAVDEPVVAVVLARGLGSRMRAAGAPEQAAGLTPEQRAAAEAGQKGMMPLPGPDGRTRPFLDFVLSALADAGYIEVALVVPPMPSDGTPDLLRAYYTGPGRPTRVRITCVVQPVARGTADAVVAASAWIAGRPFVVLNADNLYDVPALTALRLAAGPALPVYTRSDLVRTSGIPDERLGAFALLRVSPDGYLAGVVEKPGVQAIAEAGPDALISMNCWRGDAAILQACRDVPVSPRGEFELPDAIRLALSRGIRIEAIPSQGPVLDLSRRDDIATVVARLQSVEARP